MAGQTIFNILSLPGIGHPYILRDRSVDRLLIDIKFQVKFRSFNMHFGWAGLVPNFPTWQMHRRCLRYLSNTPISKPIKQFDMKLHQHFTFCIFLLLSIPTMAQTDTSRVEQYCEMVAQGRLFSNKITIDLDFGEGKSFWSFKDTRVKDELSGKVRKFKSTVDALNYLGGVGWVLVNAFPVTENTGLGGVQNVYHFFFKKSFAKSELIENKME